MHLSVNGLTDFFWTELITLAEDASLAGDFFTGEVAGGTSDPGKRLAHDPDVSSPTMIVCSVHETFNYLASVNDKYHTPQNLDM